MGNDESRRRYQLTIAEWIVIGVILAVLVILLIPALAPQRHGHSETRTTQSRAAVWLGAAELFDERNGRAVPSVEELEAVVFSDDCEFCNVPDVKLDWWGTPFRIWIDRDEYGGRQLNVQSAFWNKTFEEDDKNWTVGLAELTAPEIPDQFRPIQQGSQE